MRRLSLLFAHLAVIAALAVGSGAHWVVLQGVAWGTMLIDYSRTASLTEAVAKTFDGQHPCALCQTIASAEKQQQHEQAAQPVPPIKGVLAPTVQVVAPTYVFVEWPAFEVTADRISPAPPAQPPRSLAA